MKRFMFSLGRVLEYRAHVQDNETRTLGALKARHAALLSQRDQAARALSNLGDEYNALCEKGAAARQIAALGYCIGALRRILEEREKAVTQSKERVERQREKVVEANRNRRGLEILKEKQQNSYFASARREEEKFIEAFCAAGARNAG